MRVAALLLLVWISVTAAVVAEEMESPHRMLTPDGEADTEKCPICHEADLSLSRSKVETCTLCHSTTIHAGVAEHVAASAAAVQRLLSSKKEGAAELPLTDDGQIFCGTCHLFHDPRLSAEKALAEAWVPPSTGVPQAVRDSLASQWEHLARQHNETSADAKFATHSTKALRLPVADGSLCRHCHGSMTQ